MSETERSREDPEEIVCIMKALRLNMRRIQRTTTRGSIIIMILPGVLVSCIQQIALGIQTLLYLFPVWSLMCAGVAARGMLL